MRPEEWEALREKFRGGQAEQPEIDAMLEAKSWFCPIREQQGDRAFYSPLADYIVVPLRSQFVDMQSFYETLLHEMGHSTGHPTRLNRDLAHPFGSEEYGKEELTAEFAAALAGMFFGIAEHIRTENAAYLKAGYTSAVRKTTRTVENGCQTKFSESGACGLYVVRGTQTVYSNVKLTAERDADTGGLVWKTESPTPLAGGLLDEHYYFYYPYQARASILGQGGCSPSSLR